MGCLFSYFQSINLLNFTSGNTPRETEETPKVYSWDTRKQIDPKDFTIENKNNEVIFRMPGSIDGMQFIIQNLENCIVYLFDNVAQISIDDCKNCKFFIGPSKASVFIRDCVDCNLAAMCQQFRTRDCKRITTFLLCATQPIIESSISMKFGCISVNYAVLDEQLKKANISTFINNWNNIHDFTPVPGETNHSFIKKEAHFEEFIPYPEEKIKAQLNLSFAKADSIVPFTLGTVFRPNEESCLIVLFLAGPTVECKQRQEAQAKAILEIMKTNHPNQDLVQTKKFKFSETSSDSVFATKIYDNNLQIGPIIGLEFNGNNCSMVCQSIIQQLRLAPDTVFVSQNTRSLQSKLDNFYNFSDMQMAV